MENSTEKIRNTAGSQSSRSFGRKLDGGGGGHASSLKEILDPNGVFAVAWSKMFVVSCAFAVSLDPLFFYVPIVHEENKCIAKDTRLWTTALVLRSLTDTTFIIHIIHEIRLIIRRSAATGAATNIRNALEMSPLLVISVVVDFLAILPVPQVAILLFFLKLNGSEYFHKRSKFLNPLLLLQYLPKVYRIHLTSKKLKPRSGKWAKGAFNFFLYILASHITGAFWYFFSIQREIACWRRACRQQHPPSTSPTCMSSYLCEDNTSRNMTFLNEKCPTNPTNATLFDFGMFSDALESGTTQSINFPPKIFYSFWWALRNLSSFGQNLETSTYVWENGLAILICVMGLLLFLHLIGNVQTFMQLATIKSEETRLIKLGETRLDSDLCKKMRRKTLDMQMWMDKNGVRDKDMKREIMEEIKQKLKENQDVDMENLFSILPWRIRKSIKHNLCMDTIRKVPMLQNVDEQVLRAICGNLKQVIYTEDSFIVRGGEPLDKMLFITQGIAWTYSSCNNGSNGSSPDTHCLQKSDFYGEQLLNWATKSASFSNLPISTRILKSHTKVEAFALMAIDVNRIISKFWWHFSKEMHPQKKQWELLAISSIQATWRRRRAERKQAVNGYQLSEGSSRTQILITYV